MFSSLNLMLAVAVAVKGSAFNDLVSDTKSEREVRDCTNVILTNSSGYVSTGDFDQPNNSVSNCSFTIQRGSIANKDVYFCNCKLRGNVDACVSDHFTFNNEDAKYCGDVTSSRYRVSPENGSISIHLTMYGSSNLPTCAFVYAGAGSMREMRHLCDNHGIHQHPQKDDSFLPNWTVQDWVTSGTSCGNVEFTNNTGYITTPNYPHNYTNNVICVYKIQPEDNSRSISFHTCDCELETSGYYSYDYLQFGRNGWKASGMQSGHNYGVSSADGKHEVKFVSDGSVTKRGCKIAYSTRGYRDAQELCLHPLPQEILSPPTVGNTGSDCNSVLLRNSSGFVSIGDYNLPDRYGTVCNFIIQPEALTDFSMDFYFCNCPLKGNVDACVSDHLTFNNDDAKYCSDLSSNRYRVSSANGSVTVRFKVYGYSTFPTCDFTYAVSGSIRDTRDLCDNLDVPMPPWKNTNLLPEWSVQNWMTSGSYCGNVEFTNNTGYITTPNYPHNYTNNVICVYKIQPDDNSRSISFHTCDCELESSGYYSYDYLQFARNGWRASGMQSGHNYGVSSKDRQHEVKFVSDGSVTMRGCKLAYSTRGYQDAESMCLHPLPQEILSPLKTNKTGPDCSSVLLTNTSGFVSIGDYNLPDRYGTVCNFIIQPQAQSNFSMDFYFCDCRLKGNVDACITDHVTFNNDGTKYCGDMSSTRYRVSPINGQITVQVKVYGYSTFPSCGFTYAITGSIPETRDLCYNHALQLPPQKVVSSLPAGSLSPNNTGSTGCGKVLFNNTEGYITTPNYPHNYTNNMICVYKIQPEDNSRSVSFHTCDCELESSGYYSYDYLQFGRNGWRATGVQHGRNYGISSKDAQFELTFVSDSSVTKRGCRIAYSTSNYRAAEESCLRPINHGPESIRPTERPLPHTYTPLVNNGTSPSPFNGTSPSNNGTNYQHLNGTSPSNNGTNYQRLNGTSPSNNATNYQHFTDKPPLSGDRVHEMMEDVSRKQYAMQSVFLKFVSSVWDTIYSLIP